jgi:hypothetical protein
MIEEPVSAFSLILRFWYDSDNKTWQGEMKDAAGTRSSRFNDQYFAAFSCTVCQFASYGIITGTALFT